MVYSRATTSAMALRPAFLLVLVVVDIVLVGMVEGVGVDLEFALCSAGISSCVRRAKLLAFAI